MTKQVLIVVLVGINLLLLAGVILLTYTPPIALAQDAAAQVAAPGEDFILLSGEVELSNDAIYVLDVQNDLLHMFRTNFPRLGDQPVSVRHIVTRDLSRDFRQEEAGQ